MRYEQKVASSDKRRFIRQFWEEKMEGGWRDTYGREREEFYNRNGQGTEFVEKIRNEAGNLEGEIVGRERDIQRQWERGKIEQATYNKRYKEIKVKSGCPRYLEKENIDKPRMGNGMRALINLRCGNMEEINKYWIQEENKYCIFCGEAEDDVRHYIEECEAARGGGGLMV